MNWWTRLLSFLGGDSLRESLIPPAGAYVDADDHLYRPLTARVGTNDLSGFQHQKMLEVAQFLDRKNFLAKRLLSLIPEFVFGEGIQIKTVNKQVEEWLKRHWNDPINDWELRGPDSFRIMLRDGELLLTCAVNPVDGMVRWGRIPAMAIKEDGVITHPTNWERVEKIVLKPPKPGDEPRVLEAIKYDLETGELAGEAFFWTINPDGTRGISVLYALADLIDLFEQAIYNEAESELLRKAFVYDVTINGATADEIRKMVATEERFRAPRPGSVNIHNEQESWNVLTPNLNSADAVEAHKFRLNLITGGSGIPEHWFGMGGDVNRAVGTVMDEPTIKMLTGWQKRWLRRMTDLHRFVIDMAVQHGSLPELVEKEDAEGNPTGEMIPAREAFTLEAPDMNTTDQTQLAGAFAQLMTGLVAAEDNHYVSRETAQGITQIVLRQFGVEIDPELEKERIKQQQADAEREQAEMMKQQQDAMKTALAAPRSKPGGRVAA